MFKNPIILALLVASISCQQKAIKGWIFWNKYFTVCSKCYRRKKTESCGCGPLLPVTDICLIHYEGPGQPTDCALRRKGYGLSAKPSDPCISLPILGCLAGLDFGADGIECNV